MKNKMVDVRNHLVAMMESLGDDNANAEDMALRIERAKATSNVASQYIAAVKTELDAIRLFDETGRIASVIETPPMADRRDGRILSFDPTKRSA